MKSEMNDASEERTIFVRNLPFSASVESLRDVMSRFGAIEYCVLCVHSETQHSKGSAFVKFGAKSDADACLRAADATLCLDGRQLVVALALTKAKLEELAQQRAVKDRDKRNLYLAKEGLIYPESPAAEGVSQSDLSKRLTLETRKRKMLQNTHYFVSKTRLCVHNLPPNIDNNKLRTIFLRAVNDKSAKIIEAKVMRERKKLENKFGKSKGFGFVAFNEHIHALNALRCVNNNPTIFTSQKRPIVEFSIENKVALNIKERRLKSSNCKESPTLDKNESENDCNLNPIYMGLISKQNNMNEKIKTPKVNKKVREMRKKLKVRGKEIKKTKRNQTKKTKKEKTKVRRKERINEDKTTNTEEVHYNKRKHVFMNNSDNSKKFNNKKAKWYA